MGGRKFRRLLSIAMVFTLILSFFSSAVFAAPNANTDTKGHWAEKDINEWIGKGLIGGYQDGSFKPNAPISRAEFFALVNRAFQFTESSASGFRDVNPSDWYYSEVLKAKAAGYISGYQDGTIKPKDPITRQEVAAILARLMHVENAPGHVDQFKDKEKIPQWSSAVIGGIVAKGLMKGFNDGTFKPSNQTTRAEAVAILKRAMDGASTETKNPGQVYDKAGVYGPTDGLETIEGNVKITAAGVTLRNMVINGDLTIAEEVGNGEVFLKGVTVKGNTYVNGGGENSVHFEDTVLLTVIVNKADGTVRIVAAGKTTVQEVILKSSAKVEQAGATAAAFKTVTLSDALPKDSKVTLIGEFESVDIYAAAIVVEVPRGSIKNLKAASNAVGTSLHLTKDAKVVSFVVDAVIKAIGPGTIEKAWINVNGVNFEKGPNHLEYGKGVTNPSSNAGGGGGGSSSDDGGKAKDTTAPTIKSLNPENGAENVPIVRDLVITFSEDVTAVSGKNIKIFPFNESGDIEDEGDPLVIPVTDESVTVSGAKVTIDLLKIYLNSIYDVGSESSMVQSLDEGSDDSLGEAVKVYVTIDQGAFKDKAGNEFAGISDSTTWSFSLLISDEIFIPITVTSAFADGDAIPSQYSRDGGNVSLPVSWTAIEGAKSYFVVFTDPDADGFIHWAIKDIPSDVTSIAEGISKTDAMVGIELKNHFWTEENGFGYGYEGPQPPKKHTYELAVLALDVEKMDIADDIHPEELMDAIYSAVEDGKVIGMGQISGTFCPKVDGEPPSVANVVITSDNNVVDTDGDQLVIEFSGELSQESKDDILQYLLDEGIGNEQDNYWNWAYPNQLWIKNTMDPGTQFSIPKSIVNDEYCLSPEEDIEITIPATTLSVQGIDFPEFTDTNPAKDVISGAFEFTKAEDETDITDYTVSIVDLDDEGYKIDDLFVETIPADGSSEYSVAIDNVDVSGYTNLQLQIQPNSGDIYNWHMYRPVIDDGAEPAVEEPSIGSLIEKVGFNNETKAVTALSDIDVAADLGEEATLEVFFTKGEAPDENTEAAGSIAIDSGQSEGTELITGLSPDQGDQIWYRLIYAEGNQSEWVQDGIVEYSLVNDVSMIGEFYVIDQEGKVVVKNTGYQGAWQSLNGGYKAVVYKNGIAQEPVLIPDDQDAEITVNGGLAENDVINVALISPNGNTSALSEDQAVTITTADPVDIAEPLSETTTSDTIQITGL